MKINSLAKVKITSGFVKTKVKDQALSESIANFYKADPQQIHSQKSFLPETDVIGKLRSIVTQTKKEIINTKLGAEGQVIKKRLTPMGPDNIGWYYCDVSDTHIITEIVDRGVARLNKVKDLIREQWDGLVANGKAGLGNLDFTFPTCEEFLASAKITVKFQSGSINFDDLAIDQLSKEAAASVRAIQKQDRDERLNATLGVFDNILNSVRDRITSLEESCKKGNRLRPEKFVSLRDELAEFKNAPLISDIDPARATLTNMADTLLSVVESAHSFPDLTHDQRKVAADDLRKNAIEATNLAANIGL